MHREIERINYSNQKIADMFNKIFKEDCEASTSSKDIVALKGIEFVNRSLFSAIK
ncbi:MAG: hypothetical protein HUJ51_06380 [Eggerthellaceae bacterium]|nr:hypothetical protein [Eggerthellaceae bacterium]